MSGMVKQVDFCVLADATISTSKLHAILPNLLNKFNSILIKTSTGFKKKTT